MGNGPLTTSKPGRFAPPSSTRSTIHLRSMPKQIARRNSRLATSGRLHVRDQHVHRGQAVISALDALRGAELIELPRRDAVEHVDVAGQQCVHGGLIVGMRRSMMACKPLRWQLVRRERRARKRPGRAMIGDHEIRRGLRRSADMRFAAVRPAGGIAAALPAGRAAAPSGAPARPHRRSTRRRAGLPRSLRKSLVTRIDQLENVTGQLVGRQLGRRRELQRQHQPTVVGIPLAERRSIDAAFGAEIDLFRQRSPDEPAGAQGSPIVDSPRRPGWGRFQRRRP